ncbi:MAG: hypothetical protein JWN53_776 [Gemmatimonadetes bacterium]|nr:hypothetical protein [Gemmatimonadota bacterium]
MHFRTSLVALALVATAVPGARAQQPAAPNPYKILFVQREAIKPGRGAAHDKLESEWARSFAAAKMPFAGLAIASMTGPRETWFLSGFPTYAEYARLLKAFGGNAELSAITTRLDPQDSEFTSESRGMVLQARDDLGYGSPNLPQMRYFTITRVSVRPGHVAEFEEARKLVKQAHETAHVGDSFSVYAATAGAPAGTFYVFAPRKSLTELDDAEKIHGAEYLAALGGDEGRKKMASMAANYLISSQADHFAFVPSQSIVSARWAKEDPTFWKLQTTPPTP